MEYLIGQHAQAAIAAQVDNAVRAVLANLPNHGSEEAITSALGQELAKRSFTGTDFTVDFNYRQLSKYTEEPHAGADGGFLVHVTNSETFIRKAALFQAKLLKDGRKVRTLTMRFQDAQRLKKQSSDMLRHTTEAVVMFYTQDQIYVVDAQGYSSRNAEALREPLSDKHRLVSLGTYLGRWLPRCTRGDRDEDLIDRLEHLEGFKRGITMKVISRKPSISWNKDPDEDLWLSGRGRRGQ